MPGAIENIGLEVATEETLKRDTFEWLAELPEEVRPNLLPVRFPRMANAISRRWIDRRACVTYLDDLIIDNRGTRRGFPDEIMDELVALKNYFQTVVYPVPQTVWDEVASRSRNK
jgi:hypothetical protein